MIKTHNLNYEYHGSKAIKFPDLKIDSGDAILVCGKSGCGKTTLLHLLAGLRKPTEGQIMIGNHNLSDLSPAGMDQFRGKHIGIVFQQSYFIQSLTILDNLMISPYAGNKNKVETVANRLLIKDLLLRYPSQLSVGEQQRATIARAVMNKPKILLADEPTSALDNKNCIQVIDLLREEAIKNNAALIIVTHDDRLRDEISTCIELSEVFH